MTDFMRPFMSIYIVWHPKYAEGLSIAEALRKHFRREHSENILGGVGLSVIYRTISAPNLQIPLSIDFNEAETTATILLIDSKLSADADWLAYVHQLISTTEELGLGNRFFPVFITADALKLGIEEQAFRWYEWTGLFENKLLQLTSSLTYEFCRILRHYLEHLNRPGESETSLEAYLKKVQIFLSHSKHDNDGERIAKLIRGYLHDNSGLLSFFDVHDIPAGLKFQKVLLQQVKVSAMIAIHTDSYSSREWCRREIIEAKRWSVPLVVANCISNLDERSFPYMGNVPVVRLDINNDYRINIVISRLLDEVLKNFLWLCKVKVINNNDPSVIFISRSPELISLAPLASITERKTLTVVYPDPPLSTEEERLFSDIAPHIQLRSFTEWRAGALR